jgi:hypothetical protein
MQINVMLRTMMPTLLMPDIPAICKFEAAPLGLGEAIVGC